MNSLLDQMMKDDFDEKMRAGNSYFSNIVMSFFEQEPQEAVPAQEQVQTTYMLFMMAYAAGMVGGMTYWPHDRELHLMIQEKKGGPRVSFTIYQDGRHLRDVV